MDTDSSCKTSTHCWIVVSIIALAIGLICMTAGYLANKNYNDRYWETTCTYTAYNFIPFPWSSWDCKQCTGYYASVVTVTADGRTWYTHNAVVYPPGNSVERQTWWYQINWPIGTTVNCYQTGCCSNPPIFVLADTTGTFWAGLIFLSFGGLFIGVIILVTIIPKCANCCCRRGYRPLEESKSESDIA